MSKSTNKARPPSRARATTKAKVRPIAELWVDCYIGVVDTLLANTESDPVLEGTVAERARGITDQMLSVLEDRWPGMVV